jgi:hypothetical protein
MNGQDNASVSKQATLIALSKWVRSVGVTPVTAWRWRRAGWLPTVNICGRVYLTSTTVEEFARRAQAGEFAKVHKTPGSQQQEGAVAA